MSSQIGPSEYFGSHERKITSIGELHQRVKQVNALAKGSGLDYYWRGQANAAWGVHSLLHRSLAGLLDLNIADVKEKQVVEREAILIAAARDWIRPDVGARLTTADLMARLQHFGVPTRLVDFTREPLVALYFAVVHEPEVDGRLVIAAARGVAPVELREAFDVPWRTGHRLRPKDWTSALFCLDDQDDFLRISRQRGVFITGGTPSTRPQRRTAPGSPMNAAAVRSCMSLPLALQSWKQAESALDGTSVRGKPASVASALTLRVPAAAKKAIRTELEEMGWGMATLFPDVAGLRDHEPGIQELLGPNAGV